MAGVPIKHHTKGKTGRRRSHLAMKKQRLLVCPHCGAPKLAHRACPQCGKSAGRAKK
jgi:large subunit ribosomal protein L32